MDWCLGQPDWALVQPYSHELLSLLMCCSSGVFSCPASPPAEGDVGCCSIFVMREWAKSLGSEGSSIHMLSDGNCELAEVNCCPTCCPSPARHPVRAAVSGSCGAAHVEGVRLALCLPISEIWTCAMPGSCACLFA